MATRASRGSARSRSGQAGADRGEFYNDEPVEILLPNVPPGGGRPAPKRGSGSGGGGSRGSGSSRPRQRLSKRARFGIGNRALPGGRVVAVRRRTGRRPKTEHSAKAERSAEAERSAAAEAQADQGPGSHPGPVGVPHPVGGLDADRGHRRIRGATCGAQRAGPAPGPQARRDRAACLGLAIVFAAGDLGPDAQSRGRGPLHPDQLCRRRGRVHRPGPVRARSAGGSCATRTGTRRCRPW